MAKEGWKRTCPLSTTSPVLRWCMSLCGSTKNYSGPVQQNPAGPVAPLGWTSTQPGWSCGEKSWRKRAGEGLKIVPFSFLQLSFRAHKPAQGLPGSIHITPYIIGDTRAIASGREQASGWEQAGM